MTLSKIPFLAATLAATAFAQHTQTSTSPETIQSGIDPATTCGLQTESDHLLGCGAEYRVVFDRDGMTFTPAFGRQAPQEYPWTFTLTSVERGGEVVYLPGERDGVEPTRSELRASYARTRYITERYDVRPEGVEQSFVFARALPGQGELVVRGRIDTELHNEFRGEAADGLTFSSAFGDVTVGGVTGIDANGDTMAGSLRFDGTSMELVLPASFVDNAAYPLVLDPLVGVDMDASASSLEDGDGDIAFDRTSAQYAVVWTRSYSAGTSDVLAQRLWVSGFKTGSAYVIMAGGLNEHPSIGNSNHSGRFLCVWQTRGGPFAQNDLWMRAINADTSITNPVPLVNAVPDDRDPDVGNETGGGDQATTVVWTRVGGGIRSAEVSIPVGNADPTINGSINTITNNGNDSEPAISKGGGVVDRHAVVWTRQGFNSQDVWGAAVRLNGNLLGTPTPVAQFLDRDEKCADVDGDGTGFLVVFQVAESAGATNFDIGCRRVMFDGSTLVTDGQRVSVESDSGVNENSPAVGLADAKYLVAWSEFVVGGDNLRGVALNPVDSSRFGEEFSVEGPRPNDGAPEIATQFSAGESGSQSGDAMIAFTSRENAWIGNTSQVQIQKYEAFGGGAVSELYPGCGGGGALTIDGPFALGADVAILLQNSDPSAQIAALHIGDASSTVVPCGPCYILTPLLAVPDTISNGAARVDLSIGTDPALLDTAWRFQYVVANTTEMPCLGLPVGMTEIEQAVVAY